MANWTAEGLAEHLGVHPNTVRRELRALAARGAARPRGRGEPWTIPQEVADQVAGRLRPTNDVVFRLTVTGADPDELTFNEFHAWVDALHALAAYSQPAGSPENALGLDHLHVGSPFDLSWLLNVNIPEALRWLAEVVAGLVAADQLRRRHAGNGAPMVSGGHDRPPSDAQLPAGRDAPKLDITGDVGLPEAQILERVAEILREIDSDAEFSMTVRRLSVLSFQSTSVSLKVGRRRRRRRRK